MILRTLLSVLPVYCKSFLPPHGPTTVASHLATSLALTQVNGAEKPLEPRSKINLSSLKVVYDKYFVTDIKVLLTHQTHRCDQSVVRGDPEDYGSGSGNTACSPWLPFH